MSVHEGTKTHGTLLVIWGAQNVMDICPSSILYSLTRYVLSRFVAVASQYGVRSMMQSKGVIKSAETLSL